MRFQYLRPVGVNYQQENQTAIDVRTQHDTWKKIESGLKCEIATLRTLQGNCDDFHKQANNSREGRASDFSRTIKFFSEEATRVKKMTEAEDKIKNYREWLRREGVSADSSGKVKVPLDKTLVHYDKDLEKQGMTRVTSENGKLYIGKGAAKKVLDTSDMVSHFSGPGYGIYVMSAEGHIHVGSHVVGRYHHTSLLGGQNVAGAGELQATQGTMKFVSNKSGHHVPEAVHFNQVLHVLDKLKQNQCSVRYHYKEPKQDGTGFEIKESHFASVSDYRSSFKPGEATSYQLAKLLGYCPYIWNDKGELHPRIAGNGWRWADATKGEDWGFYDKDGAAVDHKKVRQFIKADHEDSRAKPDQQIGEVNLKGPHVEAPGEYVESSIVSSQNEEPAVAPAGEYIEVTT
jgi:hypothetical protein